MELIAATRRYRLLRRVGADARVETWLASLAGPRDMRAFLLLEKYDAHDGEPRCAEAFEARARLAAELNHDTLVTIFDLVVEPGSWWVATNADPGADLETVLRAAQTLPLTVAIHVATCICAALERAHDRALVHGRLSPASIVLGLNGVAKVGDFERAGLCEHIAPGSTPYASPEQLSGSPPDARSDIFSAARVISQMLTGAPTPVAEVLRTALAKAPRDRFERPRDFTAALEATAGVGPPGSRCAELAAFVAAALGLSAEQRRVHGPFRRDTDLGEHRVYPDRVPLPSDAFDDVTPRGGQPEPIVLR